MDRLTPERRSALMSRVRGKDTKPEMAVRRMAHAMGLRFRLYRRDLPGCPDLVFPKYRTAIFVHGCFWHRHPGCGKASVPGTNTTFWTAKFERNIERDCENRFDLERLGWTVGVIWECQTKNPDVICEFLRYSLNLKEGLHA